MISTQFESGLRKIIDGDKIASSRPLVVGKPSKILSECGAKAEQDITITKKVIDKAMRLEVRNEDGRLLGNTDHGLTEDKLICSIREIESPTLIFKGRQDGSLLVITGVDVHKTRNTVVAIELDSQEAFMQVNSIRGVYGKDNFHSS